MILSRVTFAMIDAAAIDNDLASPPTIVFTLHGNTGAAIAIHQGQRGHDSKRSNSLLHRLVSRLQDVDLVNHLCTDDPDTNARHRQNGIKQCLSLCRREFFRIIEPAGIRVSSSTTAAATTGPAHGPRPASSTPHTTCLSARAARSNEKSGKVMRRL